jgi:hypothetical protein
MFYITTASTFDVFANTTLAVMSFVCQVNEVTRVIAETLK